MFRLHGTRVGLFESLYLAIKLFNHTKIHAFHFLRNQQID